MGFMVFKSTGLDSRFQRKNWFWKILHWVPRYRPECVKLPLVLLNKSFISPKIWFLKISFGAIFFKKWFEPKICCFMDLFSYFLDKHKQHNSLGFDTVEIRIFWVHINFELENFGFKIIWEKRIFGSGYFLKQKYFGPQKLGSQHFWEFGV